MKRLTCKIKWFGGRWTIMGKISKTNRTVLPSFRGKFLCLSTSGAMYYASQSEMENVSV